MFSVDRKIPNVGSTFPVGNKVSWNGGPSGWDLPASNEHQWWILSVWYARKKLAEELPIRPKNTCVFANPTNPVFLYFFFFFFFVDPAIFIASQIKIFIPTDPKMFQKIR